MKYLHHFLLIAALFLLSGKVQQVSAQALPLDSVELPQVGSMLDGALVYFVDEAARRVLVVALNDAPADAKNFYRTWGECGQDIAAASDVDDGKKNSAAIIAAQVVTQDIDACRDNTVGKAQPNYKCSGFTLPADTARRAAHWCSEQGAGWFLPSREQLKKLYELKSEINAALTATEGAAPLGDGYYWSSTQLDANNAWYTFFDNGETNASTKSNAGNVRPIKEYVYRSEPDTETAVEKNSLQLSLYPTVTAGLLYVSGAKERVKVEVYSLVGTLLMSREYGGGAFSLDLSGMPKGMLLVRLSCGGKSATKQVVKL